MPMPFPLSISTDPMQRSIDNWYREQPTAFTRAAEPDVFNPAEQAIALNHLLTYGRLAGERDLIDLREQAIGRVAPALLEQTRARDAELLAKAPTDLQPTLRAGLASIKERLMQKAAAIDAATAMRTREAAIEQSVQMGEAVLKLDPEQYAELVADAEDMTSKLDLPPEERDALFRSIRQRYADAARGQEVVSAKAED
jgi:hypothetical protein